MACEDPAGLEPGGLRAALASLSDSDQEVLRLVAWDGLTPAEVAVVLGCTPVAARPAAPCPRPPGGPARHQPGHATARASGT